MIVILIALVIASTVIANEQKKANEDVASDMFSHERAMAEAKGILQMLGVNNPTAAQLQEMTETVKTTGLSLADLKAAHVSFSTVIILFVFENYFNVKLFS